MIASDTLFRGIELEDAGMTIGHDRPNTMPEATEAICRACRAESTDSAGGVWSCLALMVVVAMVLFFSRYSTPSEASASLDGGWHVPAEAVADGEPGRTRSSRR